MNVKEIMSRLKANARPQDLEQMARFGITPERALGVRVPVLRELAKEVGKDHGLALKLWKKDTRETRILATMIADPKETTEKLMEGWVKGFDYWEICDQACMNLFEKMACAYEKAVEWSKRRPEGEKRAGYVMMARLAVSDKKAPDKKFERFFPHIKRGATDDRNLVKKGVNWALRQIGKRSLALNKKGIDVAKDIKKMDSKAAKWVASDALRELTSEAVKKRLKKR